jgi:hypothetical protein
MTKEEKDPLDELYDFDTLPSWKKMLVFLVCRKAMLLREVVSDERIGPKEISKSIGINEASARDISRNKFTKKLVKGEKGKYYIPNFKLKSVKEVLNDKNTDSSS